MSPNQIFFVVGIGLLILGGASGIALFFQAFRPEDKISKNGIKTLWVLFILGLIFGLFLVGNTRPW